MTEYTFYTVQPWRLHTAGEASGPWCPRCGYSEGHAQDCREMIECAGATVHNKAPGSRASTRTQAEGSKGRVNQNKGTEQEKGGVHPGGIGVGLNNYIEDKLK